MPSNRAPLLLADLFLHTSDRKSGTLGAKTLAEREQDGKRGKSQRAPGESAAALPRSLATCVPRTSSSGSSSSAQLHGMCEPHPGLAAAILGVKHEACDCSAVVGRRALDCSLAQMGAIHKEHWESDFLFLLECCLVPASKYRLVA